MANTTHRDALHILAEHESVTKLSIIVKHALNCMAKKDAAGQFIVYDYKPYRVYKYIKTELGMDWVNQQSVINALNVLKYMDLISTYREQLDKNPALYETSNIAEEDLDNLVLKYEGQFEKSDPEYHIKNKGYIHIHDFIFTKEFYDLELRDMKVALLTLSKLNNVDKKTTPWYIKNPNKLRESERAKTKSKYEYLMKVCKVNRLAHLKSIFKRLQKFFNIALGTNTTYILSLNSLSKSFRKKAAHYLNVTPSEVIQIEKTFKNATTKHRIKNLRKLDIDFRELTRALKSFSLTTTSAAIFNLCYQLSVGTDIENIPGYAVTIAKSI